MPNFVRMFQEGGPFMYLLLAAFPAATLAILVLAVFAAFRFRVPLGLWLAPPFAVLGIGWLGTAQGSGMALEAMAQVSPEMFVTLSAAGHSVALYTAIAAALIAMPLFLLVAASAAFGNLLHAGERRVWTYGQALFICIVGWTGAIAAFASEFASTGRILDAKAPLLIALVTAVATLPLAVSSIVSSSRAEDAPRLAAGRLAAACSALLAVAAVALGMYDYGYSEMSSATAHASLEMREKLIGHALADRHAALVAGLTATVSLVLASAVALLPVGGHLGDRRGVLDALSLVVLVPLLAAIGWGELQIGQVATVANDRGAFTEWAAKTADLPTMGRGRSVNGLCLVRRRGTEWVAEKRFASRASTDCGEDEAPALLPFSRDALPVVAVSGSTGIGTLVNTQWSTGETPLTLVGAILSPLPPPNPTMTIRWRSTGPEPGDAVADLHLDGVEIAYQDVTYTSFDELPRDAKSVFVRPDPRLKVQNLIDACEHRSCVISPAR